MDDLVQFLRARLDEDELIARDASVGAWTKAEAPSIFVMSANGLVAETSAFTDARHIARHDPARVLAEVDAKRQILDVHASEDTGDPFDGCRTCSWRDYMDVLHVRWPCPTLRLMLTPYSDHPDYRAEWAIQPPDPDDES
ncbi:DUF6221 family protein [Streptomyces sp. NPDC006544]|uniref:DUF6221 family protein n=1 Tax=Streptomyces sp. NPDC006544 TaxID=3154583 RepID=UPI0033B0A5F5